ncbi:MAG: hypothetical protein AB7H77_00870 [Bdellovibrionales bacterium]
MSRYNGMKTENTGSLFNMLINGGETDEKRLKREAGNTTHQVAALQGVPDGNVFSSLGAAPGPGASIQQLTDYNNRANALLNGVKIDHPELKNKGSTGPTC